MAAAPRRQPASTEEQTRVPSCRAGSRVRPQPRGRSSPGPPQLTSSRTRVRSGVLRVFRGPSLPGAGAAGTSLARGKQRVGGAGGPRGPPPTYSQAGGSGVLLLVRGEPREVGALVAGLRGARRLCGTEGSRQRSPSLPQAGTAPGGVTLTPVPGAGGSGRRPGTLPFAPQLRQPALPGGHGRQGGTRDGLAGLPAPPRAAAPPDPRSLLALAPLVSPSLGGRELQPPTALPAGSLCTGGEGPQARHGWDSGAGTPHARGARR